MSKRTSIDIGGTPVNDGFVAACYPARPHLLLQNGGNQFRLDCDRTFPILVAVAHLQGIDVVGAVWGNFNDRSQQSPAQVPVRSFCRRPYGHEEKTGVSPEKGACL